MNHPQTSVAPPRPESAPIRNIADLQKACDVRQSSWEKVMPKHVNPQRFAKGIVLAVSKNPALLNADTNTLFQQVMIAAQLGLDCSGTLGSAYLIPFKNTVQLIIGYRGLIDLARRSREIRSVAAHLVYQNDDFEVSLGTSPSIRHIPRYDGDRGPVRLAYAVAELVGGGTQFEVMNLDQLEAIRKGSRNGESGPWSQHRAEMYRKTVMRRLVKWLPLSPELIDAVQAEEAEEVEPKPVQVTVSAPVEADVPFLPEPVREREPGEEG